MNREKHLYITVDCFFDSPFSYFSSIYKYLIFKFFYLQLFSITQTWKSHIQLSDIMFGTRFRSYILPACLLELSEKTLFDVACLLLLWDPNLLYVTNSTSFLRNHNYKNRQPSLFHRYLSIQWKSYNLRTFQSSLFLY